MTEKRGNQRDQDPTQLALEAASRALAAANAAVQAAFKALAASSGEPAGDMPRPHPPARARARKAVTREETPGLPAPPWVEDATISALGTEVPADRRGDEVEVALREGEVHARKLELEAREAAMALYAPMEPPRRVPAKPQADLNGYTVLVVDDEEQVRALTVRILSRYGYRVLEAPGVEIALTLLEEPTADVDVVLSDVAMPGLSGKDLFRAISQSRPGLPVVFMSGYALGVYAPDGLLEEGVKMLPKPFTQEDLLGFVTEALEGAAAKMRPQ